MPGEAERRVLKIGKGGAKAGVSKDQAETSVLFELIGAGYERRSLLVTANQPIGECESYRRRAALVEIYHPDRLERASTTTSLHRYLREFKLLVMLRYLRYCSMTRS